MSTVFNTEEPPVPPVADPLVVGDKVFKTVEQLAASKQHADQFIDHLKDENRQLREQLANSNVSQELMDKLLQRTEQPAPAATPPQPGVTPAITDEDLVNRIRNVTKQETEAQRLQANVDQVATKLIETYGDEDKANAVVKQKAQELGVSVAFLQDAASRSPAAFFNVIGLTGAAPTPQPLNRSDVNPQSFEQNQGTAKPGTKGFYDNIRRTDPNNYFSAKVQNQIYKDKLAGTYIP